MDLKISAFSHSLSVFLKFLISSTGVFLILTTGPNRLTYASVTPPLLTIEWSSPQQDFTVTVAWGDFDNDGDIDLLAGNGNIPARPIQLYQNEGGALNDTPVWEAIEETNLANRVAWGDYDNDGLLDFAVGNDDTQPNRIYRNNGFESDGVTPNFSMVWEETTDMTTSSLAWGDFDNDNDLDLAIGNDNQANQLYRNDGLLPDEITPIFVLAWSSTEILGTSDIAWGDYNHDGYLDLAVGNGSFSGGEVNQLYLNNSGTLPTTATWTSEETDITLDVAWGDYDKDGALDLAVGNVDGPNRLYRNIGGPTFFEVVWSSAEADGTFSVDWGDYDNDGDIDLAAGNRGTINGQPNRVYENVNGALSITASWSSPETDLTNSISWGDIDNDGDLDLAVGNGTNTSGQPNRIYKNNLISINSTPIWQSAQADDTTQLAWGDYDGDGDLDLAIGNMSQPNRLYRNNAGSLEPNPVWSSAEADNTSDLAWGDYDEDGDLDLAVANFGNPARLYQNNNGVMSSNAIWSSNVSDAALSIAWGDFDNDGDLDLATGSTAVLFAFSPIRVYRNETLNTNIPIFTQAWSSGNGINYTYSIAWGDYDGDGDLDLLAGNAKDPLDLLGGGHPNWIYRNDDGNITASPIWISPEADLTHHVAWADYDADGDLDFIAGNYGEPNRLYENEAGTFTAIWNSVEADATNRAIWGDYDGDGDLDLATSNGAEDVFQPVRLYQNQAGNLTPSAVWSSSEAHNFSGLAWGDMDQDGDLDLAAGAVGAPNLLYQNLTRESGFPLNAYSTVTVARPGTTPEADFYSTPEILVPDNGVVTIAYKLYDPEGDTVPRIIPEYSPNGGGQWFSATPATGGDGLTNLTASPNGTSHTFHWDAQGDLIKSDHLVFRIRAQSAFSPTPLQWPAIDGKSSLFRFAVPFYIKVVNDNGQVVPDIPIYANGQIISPTVTGANLTDSAGLLNPGLLPQDTILTAVAPVFEQPTLRLGHAGWAYRVYLTNLDLDLSGNPHPTTVVGSGEQRLVVRADNPLILFNILVSVEWDADEAYLAMLDEAFQLASDYLYDVSDGQMAFGTVQISDQGRFWSDADFQISTKNVVRPYAYIGAITTPEDSAHAIRVGRFWNGTHGHAGAWNEPNGYRTLIHEFSHYALYLYDEYFVRTLDENGDFVQIDPAACLDTSVQSEPEAPGNASIMYYQYRSSELADLDRWTSNCQETEQARQTQGEDWPNGQPDWQTVLEYYSGPDWQLNTPLARGSVMAGPDQFPRDLLPFPNISLSNSGTDPSPRSLLVRAPGGSPLANALVTIYTTPYTYTVALDQGFTGSDGTLTILGATSGDIVQVVTLDNAFNGGLLITSALSYELILDPNTGLNHSVVSSGTPHLTLKPGSDGDSLSIKIQGLTASSQLLDVLVRAFEINTSPLQTLLAYSPEESAYIGTLVMGGVEPGSSNIDVSGTVFGQQLDINTNFNLIETFQNVANALLSEDGNAQLYLPAGGLPNNTNGYAIVVPTGYLPAALPAESPALGSAYVFSFSGAGTQFEKPGLLTLYYHLKPNSIVNNLQIFYWDPVLQNWQPLEGFIDSDHNSVTAVVIHPGIYALGGELSYRLHLPVIFSP